MMASSEHYKLDNGDSYCSNCFPIRSFFHQRREGVGHWLVAHRNSVEHKYRRGQVKTEGHKFSNSDVSEGKQVKNIPGNTLDGNLLMKLHCVDQPSDLCSVDISEQRLNSVKTEDLVDFDNVAYVNASDNSLPIEPFSKFSSLRELELSLNSLCNITFNPDGFPHLEVLDLSFNNLSVDDIMSIGLLPCLKALHLTHNQLQALPPNLAAPHKGPSQSVEDAGTRFRALELLSLDDNKLSSGVFSSVANLKRLQYLNLQGNYISDIPYMQQTGRLQHLPTENKRPNDSKQSCKEIKNDSGESRVPHNSQSPISPDTVKRKESSGAFTLPLPELRFLNLANNKIFEEEGLLAVALFPMLNELVIHSNPLTMERSGDPPVLTYFLQERLGIRIVRKKTPEVVKPPLMISADSKRKVKTKIRKVPKASILMTTPTLFDNPVLEMGLEHKELCMSPGSLERQSTLSSGPQTKLEEKKEGSVTRCSDVMDAGVESANDPFRDRDSFFVTQVTNLPDSNKLLLDMTEDLKEIEKKDCIGIPEKLKGYELLWDAKPDPDMVEPVGIQFAVRMLEHTLKNLLVYRDSQPKLDCLQTPFTEKEKKIGKLPTPRPRKLKGERFQEMLQEMKDRKTITKIHLNSVLEEKDVYKEEYEEALTLLRDMKKKYKMVHVKTVEQATHIESETNNQMSQIEN
ncbi:X-ray radiation resistance-associated protein 1 [Hypomesus transpacificus]|uniref:X-ray radiation resistance-associated protein 1 n=1 Tax=Hypomesus transpacificus TaxID=137520 RepID=UPI001F0781B1|nr:X-ray radiation resistance-associated protein 1 [Hypomesus transpacificus]